MILLLGDRDLKVPGPQGGMVPKESLSNGGGGVYEWDWEGDCNQDVK